MPKKTASVRPKSGKLHKSAKKVAAKSPPRKPVGRPSSYRAEYAKQAGKLAQLGATDGDLAEFFGVSQQTIDNWKASHKGFLGSLKAGKSEADDRVERSLYQRAIGYEQTSVKIFMPKDAVDPVYAPFRERIAPDTTACIFWLKNRRREEWRDRHDHTHAGKVTLESLILGADATD